MLFMPVLCCVPPTPHTTVDAVSVRPIERQNLVGRHADGWLTGWLAVVLWLVSRIASSAHHPFGSWGLPLFWPATVLMAMHFGMTYRLAYADAGAAMRRRPFALVIAPAILAAVLIGVVATALAGGRRITTDATQAAITSVFLLTTWHYIKQVYGIARIGARYRGISLSAREVTVLRYGLYPLWGLGVARLLVGRGSRFAGFHVGIDLLPGGVITTMRFLAAGSAIVIGVAVVSASRRAGVAPPALIVAPYLAAFLWIAWPTDYFGTVVGLGALHGLQYLACCRRAETSLGLGRLTPRTALRWLELFGGAACGGLLATAWAPQLLNRVMNIDDAPLLFSAVFFVFLNLHHYLIDAVIWRSTGDLVRSMSSPSPNAPAATTARVVLAPA
jgi:hypothetical protein